MLPVLCFFLIPLASSQTLKPQLQQGRSCSPQFPVSTRTPTPNLCSSVKVVLKPQPGATSAARRLMQGWIWK